MGYGQYSTGSHDRTAGARRVPADKQKRAKTVYPTGEIAHLWAHKVQDAARNPQGNFYFNGDTIYSYGSHFPIARYITGTGKRAAILFTTQSHSNTTAKHVSHARSSIPADVPVFLVNSVAATPASIRDGYAKRIGELTAKLRAVLTPAPVYPPLKRIMQKIARIDEPIPAFAGKRLCINQNGFARWSVTHIVSGLSVYMFNTRAEAREALARLDSMKLWDSVTETGDMGAARAKLGAAVSRAAFRAVKLSGVNRHPGHITKLYRELESETADANRFNAFFGYRRRFTIADALRETAAPIIHKYDQESGERSARASAAADARRAARHAEWEQRSAQYRAEQAERERNTGVESALSDVELSDKWRRGERVYSDARVRQLPTMLRINGDEVTTSLGATVPIAHAIAGLAVVRRIVRTGKPYQHNGHTIHLGHYRIDSIDAEGTLRAGCHVISYQEIERLAPELERYAGEQGLIAR